MKYSFLSLYWFPVLALIPVAVSATPENTIAGLSERLTEVRGPLIKIQDSKGKYDFAEIDPFRHRLLASHVKDGTADFIDLDKNELIKRLKVGPAVDMAVDPIRGKYFVSVSTENRVAVVDAEKLEETGSIPMDGPTDAILFAPKSRRVYAAHDNGDHLWVIDADTEKLVTTIDLPGVPEYMVYDGDTDRIYLNIKTTNEIAVIDPTSNTITAHWPTAPAKSPHGLALDSATGHLFSAGGNGFLVMLNTNMGQVTQTAKITELVDQIAFDPHSHRVYCAGPEKMSVVLETTDSLKSIGEIQTAPTAKNVVVDVKRQTIWSGYVDGNDCYLQSWLIQE